MSTDVGVNFQKVDTVLNADSVEWCPYLNRQQILICGTYKLQETSTDGADESSDTSNLENASEGISSGTREPQVRLGGVTVYEVVFKDGLNPFLEQKSKVDMCGVLDIKWPGIKANHKAYFGVVDAEGYLQIFHLPEESNAVETVAKKDLSESSLGLSLGWTENCEGSQLVAASDSAGCLSVFELNDSVSQVSSWKAHDYEAWIVAFQNFDKNILYSGGDDCKLKGWDLRDTSRPTFTSKRHQMGVCSIQAHPFNKHLVATGSYDEELLIWDNRNFKKPLSSVSLGGGVWRIKWDRFTGTKILTATMYNGTHIVDCSNLDQSTLPIIVHYDDHNLAYGADWCRLDSQGTLIHSLQADSEKVLDSSAPASHIPEGNNSFLISTCSFYDHSLHLWSWNPGQKIK